MVRNRMNRRLALSALLAALIGSGVAGLRLAEVSVAPVVDSLDRGQPAGTDAPIPAAVPESKSLTFLPIFGSALPLPQVVGATAAASPAARIDYLLKGLIASGAMRWAVLSGTDGDILVREGDDLGPDLRIVGIFADRVDIAAQGSIVSLRFIKDAASDADRPAAASTPVAETGQPRRTDPTPSRQMVGSQPMSREEVFALLEAAGDRSRP